MLWMDARPFPIALMSKDKSPKLNRHMKKVRDDHDTPLFPA